jgi:hypothetical protein
MQRKLGESSPSPLQAPSFIQTIFASLCIFLTVIFAWRVISFYDPHYGLTSLISIGDLTDKRAIESLKKTDHYVYRNSVGYDGAYYVQLALQPTLKDPTLTVAIDNLQYRARRIFMSWVAWLLGGGQPESVVRVFPFVNIIAWFILAITLLHWFRPLEPDGFVRWAGLLFSQGTLMSVRHSLVDLPALCLIALGMLAIERRRSLPASVTLSLAVLTRETSALVAVGFDWKKRRWQSIALFTVLILPLLFWIAYLKLRFPSGGSVGFNNFALPMSGLAEKWGECISSLIYNRVWFRDWGTVACLLSITVQGAFFAFRRNWKDSRWRVGASFALMSMFLSRPVWEGSPGAAPRVLLPMALCFNIIVPKGLRSGIILVAGNLLFLASFNELEPPARFYTLSGPHSLTRSIELTRDAHWYEVENRGKHFWCWSSGSAGLTLRNTSGIPLAVEFHGSISGYGNVRPVTVFNGDTKLWAADVSPQPLGFELRVLVPPGEHRLSFATENSPIRDQRDERTLAFSIADLALTVTAAPADASHEPEAGNSTVK